MFPNRINTFWPIYWHLNMTKAYVLILAFSQIILRNQKKN